MMAIVPLGNPISNRGLLSFFLLFFLVWGTVEVFGGHVDPKRLLDSLPPPSTIYPNIPKPGPSDIFKPPVVRTIVPPASQTHLPEKGGKSPSSLFPYPFPSIASAVFPASFPLLPPGFHFFPEGKKPATESHSSSASPPSTGSTPIGSAPKAIASSTQTGSPAVSLAKNQPGPDAKPGQGKPAGDPKATSASGTVKATAPVSAAASANPKPKPAQSTVASASQTASSKASATASIASAPKVASAPAMAVVNASETEASPPEETASETVGEGEPPSDEKLTEAESLFNDKKWAELQAFLGENPKLEELPRGMEMKIQCLLQEKAINYQMVKRVGDSLIGTEGQEKNPWGNLGLAHFWAYSKKPDLAKALKHADIARSPKRNPPAGASTLYWTIYLKKNWLYGLILVGVIVAGADSARKKAKARQEAARALETLSGAPQNAEGSATPAPAPEASPGTQPPPAPEAQGQASVAPPQGLKGKLQSIIGSIMAKIRRKPGPPPGPTAEMSSASTGNPASGDVSPETVSQVEPPLAPPQPTEAAIDQGAPPPPEGSPPPEPISPDSPGPGEPGAPSDQPPPTG